MSFCFLSTGTTRSAHGAQIGGWEEITLKASLLCVTYFLKSKEKNQKMILCFSSFYEHDSRLLIRTYEAETDVQREAGPSGWSDVSTWLDLKDHVAVVIC